MRIILAVLVGKAILFLTRAFRVGGGAAAPGYYALKLEPKLLEKLINQIPKNIIITGTNGKTTTSRLLNHFIKTQGLKVIRNTTGSNLERGIVSSLISHLHPLRFTLSAFDLGIWEIDEAAFNTLAPKIKPDLVVFLNVSRDQLDRYGEVDSVVGKWHRTLESLPKSTKVILNADDGNIASLSKFAPGKILTFGVKDEQIIGETENKIRKSLKLDLEARDIIIKGLTGSEFIISSSNYQLLTTCYLLLPGLYHVYDLLAAFLTGLQLKIAPEVMINSLRDFSPAFGRIEKVILKGDKEAIISLIKNPTGATQVFKTLAPIMEEEDRLLIALNDKLADGTDVSWIWDVPFGEFKIKNSKFKIVCSGTRAEDMAVRLKYAGVNQESIIVENNLSRAFEEAKKGLKGRLFIFPTYTALLTLQRLLAKQGLKRHYWEEK